MTILASLAFSFCDHTFFSYHQPIIILFLHTVFFQFQLCITLLAWRGEFEVDSHEGKISIVLLRLQHLAGPQQIYQTLECERFTMTFTSSPGAPKTTVSLFLSTIFYQEEEGIEVLFKWA